MKKCLIFLSVLLIAVLLFVSCSRNIDIPQIETTSPELTENTTTSTASTEQTTEPIETTPTTEATTQAEIIAPIETTAQTEMTVQTETTTSKEEPTTETWPKIVSADTIILDKITDKFKYSDVKKFLDDENDMESFTKKFNVKYYKSLSVKDGTAFSRTKDGTKITIYLSACYRTIVLTTPGYLMVDFYIGNKYVEKDFVERSVGEGYFISYRLISLSNDNVKNILMNFEIGTNVKIVRTADPDGKYEFLSASSSEYPAYSYHCFEDGTGISIKYDSDWNIEQITLFYL